jgi:tetraacyldisaccharide 4'-kinase
VRGLHEWFLQTWYGTTRRGAWLLPLSWVFAGAAGIRRRLYAAGLLGSYRSSRPVIVVGNVTVGGTGKTPLVIWLVERLRERGFRPGVVSRGYSGGAREPRRVRPGDSPRDVGDEPALIARRTEAPVAVGADRPGAVRLLEPDCDVIVSDDGLQHYRLARDAEIVVVDGLRGLGNEWRLPAGPLREPASRLDDASAVVVNGEGFEWPGALQMRMVPQRFVGVANGEALPPQSLLGRKAHAVAAIGHPERFFQSLRDLGIDVLAHPLPDHAVPGADDIRFGDDLPVLMTEKDAVKCADAAGPAHWYLEVGAAFEADGAARLLATVERACRPSPTAAKET